MKTSQVYLIFDPSKNEVFYVGIGKPGRSKTHVAYVRNSIKKNPNFTFVHGRHIRIAALLHDGIEPDVKIVFDDLTSREAQKKEIELIYNFGRLDLGTGPLTNRTKGGEWISVCPRTESWLANMSASSKIAQNRPEVKKLKSEALLGRVRTDEQTSRIKEAQHKLLIEGKNPKASSCVVDGVLYPSIRSAMRALGISYSKTRTKVRST